ncbi:hypothetical protein MTO96_041310 [Rhipicephalus appendiculatus]
MDYGIFKEKIDIVTPDNTGPAMCHGAPTRKRLRPVSRKRLTAASRLPRLPTEHFRVIFRPRGGLNIKKTGHFKIAQALIAAAGLTSGEVEEDIICPNMIQNIMVASTPSEKNAKAYNTVTSIIIDNVTYEVNAYTALQTTRAKE